MDRDAARLGLALPPGLREADHLFDQLIEIDWRKYLAFLARAVKLTESIYHAARVPGRRIDHLQVTQCLFFVRQGFRPLRQEFAETENGGERVIEIVGNATGHGAQGSQALLLDYLLLRGLQFLKG